MKTASRLDLVFRLLQALLGLTVAIAALGWFNTARADDIDIYSMPGSEGFRPNVLVILDNTANWGSSIATPICDAPGALVRGTSPNNEEGTKMGAEKCALFKLISNLSVADLSQSHPVESFRVQF